MPLLQPQITGFQVLNKIYFLKYKFKPTYHTLYEIHTINNIQQFLN